MVVLALVALVLAGLVYFALRDSNSNQRDVKDFREEGFERHERENILKDDMSQENIERMKECRENLEVERCSNFSRERR